MLKTHSANGPICGITFSLLGVVLLIGTTDLERYAPMLRATLGVLFMAGVARAIS